MVWKFCLLSILSGVMMFGTQASPKELLADALSKQENITFTSKTVSGEGKFRVEQRIYQQGNPDGTKYKRIETISSERTVVFLENDEGRFELFPTTKEAVKRNFNEKSAMPNYDEYAKYEVQDGKWENRVCYIVTKRIVPADSVRSRFIASLPRDIHQGMSREDLNSLFRNSFISTMVYYIDKSNLFILAREYYTQDGKLKSKFAYREIDFFPEFDPDLFRVPVGYQLKIAGNVSELLNATAKIDQVGSQNRISSKSKSAEKPGLVSNLAIAFNRNGSRILTVSSRILFWGAILTLAAAMTLKLRKKHKR